MPLFSVVIPTYHRNESLAKCLDCLSPGIQTLPAEAYEVIVTDDGCETTAEEMIRDRHPWVRWVAGSRKGPAANRNNGARFATGAWLAFTDDDCLPSASWLSAFASAIASDIFVYEGKTTCEAGIKSPLEHAPANLTGGYLWSCNMLIKTSIFKYLGGFDENFPHPHLEDVDLRDRIQDAGYIFQFVEKAVVDHPPRKRPWGSKLGATHESFIYYAYKRNHKNISLNLLRQILIVRAKTILSHPINLDSFMAMLSLYSELFYVGFKIMDWNKKYKIIVKR
jgi:GT2 family glycosyltransferase